MTVGELRKALEHYADDRLVMIGDELTCADIVEVGIGEVDEGQICLITVSEELGDAHVLYAK